nr:hypothetical protein [uncultured Flavobacterium sp.]
MKNTFKGIALVAIVSLLLFACSNDNDVQTENASQIKNTSLTSRESGEVYEDFKDLMGELYDDSQVVEETVSYKQDSDTYLLSEVTLDGTLKGYFLEDTKTNEVVYFSEDKTNKTLDYYTSNGGIISKVVYDLTKDPNYAIDGFTPETPNVLGRRRFFGSSETAGEIYQIGGQCYQNQTQHFYVLWVEVYSNTEIVGVRCP